jgi:hypothetical protein
MIVTISVTALFASNSNLSFFKVLRMIRVLRPLRVISRNQGLRIAVSALLLAMPNIINVLSVSILFFLICGITAVNYMKGKFSHCQEKFDLNPLDKWDCLDQGGQWDVYHYKFDNVLEAMVSLFHVASTVGWAEVMYRATAMTSPDLEPSSMERPSYIFGFIGFMIIGSFFMLNLFVGIVISTFNREKERLGKNFLLTDKQKEWLEMKLLMVKSKPKRTISEQKSWVRDTCLHVC